ncbi:zinc finger protein 91-like [Aedes albopictus]|uniref:C2H2-type domain-containing protein n=1 Tax=Aedes albopictus TaxID=7160 RepID=A0ABM1ZLE4_AEDAL
MKCCNLNTKSNHTAETIASMEIILKAEPVQEVQCEACLGRFPEDDLPQHRTECMVRLVLRCGICNADYLGKGGLWNHLDTHEVANESKDSYSTEERISHRLHTCSLCDDQRAFDESSYWEHIHEDHDGFYLKCSECGESFRSKKLRAYHTSNHCRPKKTPDVPDLLVKQEIISLDLPMQVDRFDSPSDRSPADSDEQEETSQNDDHMQVDEEPLAEIPAKETVDTKCPHCAKDLLHEAALKLHVKDSHKPTKCDKCDRVFEGRSRMSYHKAKIHREPKFFCPHCPKTFHLLSTYQPHLDAHFRAESYPCDICEKQCKDLRYLGQHYRRHHYPNEHFQKIYAALKARDQGDRKAMDVFKEASVRVKEEVESESGTEMDHQSEKWTGDCCPICEERFDERERILEHVEAVHKVVICILCGMTLDNADQLNDHKISCASNQQELTEGNPYPTVSDSQEQKLMDGPNTCTSHEVEEISKMIAWRPTGTRCPHCDKDFKDSTILAGHIECCHEPIVCDVCGITSYGTTEARDHKTQLHGEKLFKCVHCPKKLQSKAFYVAHLTKHLKDRKLTCETCGHKFKTADSLITHFTKVHNVENAYLKVHRVFKDCYLQDPELAAENGLQNDNIALLVEVPIVETLAQRQEPSGESPDKDSTPTKQPNPQDKKSSPKTSRNNSKCPHCGKTYSNNSRLQNHIDEQHGPSSSKNSSKPALPCPHCPKVFYANWRLNDHFQEAHCPIQCDICGENLVGKVQARYHRMKRHTEPKLQCPHCPDRFHLKNQLTRHISKHLQERNFPCDVCGARFKDQHYLQHHVVRMHRLKDGSMVISSGGESTREVASTAKVAQSPQIEFVSIKQEMDES